MNKIPGTMTQLFIFKQLYLHSNIRKRCSHLMIWEKNILHCFNLFLLTFFQYNYITKNFNMDLTELKLTNDDFFMFNKISLNNKITIFINRCMIIHLFFPNCFKFEFCGGEFCCKIEFVCMYNNFKTVIQRQYSQRSCPIKVVKQILTAKK